MDQQRGRGRMDDNFPYFLSSAILFPALATSHQPSSSLQDRLVEWASVQLVSGNIKGQKVSNNGKILLIKNSKYNKQSLLTIVFFSFLLIVVCRKIQREFVLSFVVCRKCCKLQITDNNMNNILLSSVGEMIYLSLQTIKTIVFIFVLAGSAGNSGADAGIHRN